MKDVKNSKQKIEVTVYLYQILKPTRKIRGNIQHETELYLFSYYVS